VARRTGPRLDRLLDEARQAELTYDHDRAGATLAGDGGAGRVRARRLGRGDDVFLAAAKGLRSWAPQRALGATVHPPGVPVATGTTALLLLPPGPFGLVIPVRVVRVVDEPGRFGFAYGTLPGHPERGEQGFVVERLEDGTVRATIRLAADPGPPAARALAPLVRLGQIVAVRRYLTALAHCAAGDPPGG
jgi:uncharacterized protein (UPF0548 family)